MRARLPQGFRSEPPKRPSFVAHFATALALLSVACAGQGGAVNTTPLSREEARLFDRSVDFMGRVGGLEGRWREDWDRDLSRRVAASDLIVIVHVRKSRTDRDPEGRITHRLYGDVERILRGSAPGPEIELFVREGEPGFTSIHENLLRLQGARLVAYVKWYESETGREGHFHLAPASPDVVQETEARLAIR